MASSAARRIRVGVIGLSTQGWASWGLIPPMLQLEDSPYEIAAICTSKPKSAEQQEVLRSKYGRDLKIYSSPQEIAQAPDLDLIVVSVRAPDHEKSVMPALDPGLSKKKDIFIEWPACGNLTSCELMAKKANQLGVRVMIGLQGRQSPVLKKVDHIHISKFVFSWAICLLVARHRPSRERRERDRNHCLIDCGKIMADCQPDLTHHSLR
jgi:predicted dehydrogenase